MTYQLLTHAQDADIPALLAVYRLPAVSKYISIDEENYWNYVTTTENVFFYKVYENDMPVAAVHLELYGRVLFMDIVVFPEHQRHGIGTQILKDIQRGYLGIQFDKIQVSIDENNIPSRNLFENSGFVCTGQDEELMEYVYILGTSPF